MATKAPSTSISLANVRLNLIHHTPFFSTSGLIETLRVAAHDVLSLSTVQPHWPEISQPAELIFRLPDHPAAGPSSHFLENDADDLLLFLVAYLAAAEEVIFFHHLPE